MEPQEIAKAIREGNHYAADIYRLCWLFMAWYEETHISGVTYVGNEPVDFSNNMGKWDKLFEEIGIWGNARMLLQEIKYFLSVIDRPHPGVFWNLTLPE